MSILNTESRKLSTTAQAWVENLKADAEELAVYFSGFGSSREMSLALTHLETAVMFAVKAIAIKYGEEPNAD